MSNKGLVRGKSVPSSDLYLDELQVGTAGPLVVMVCRKWDVYNKKGTLMSTDFIVSDQMGSLMHCVLMHNRSNRLAEKIQEGQLYSFAGFTVKPNRSDFRILEDSPYMLEFDGSTSAKKVAGDVTAYERYGFQLCAFEKLVPTDNKYFVDLIGYVISVGELKSKSNGAQTLEFNFTNESGRQVGVTLWGTVGEEMLKKKEAHPGAYSCILTSMSVKKYRGELGTSSSSSTQIIDGEDVPALQSFKIAIRDHDFHEPIARNPDTHAVLDTLEGLLKWGRDWKAGSTVEETILFRNTIEIVDVRTRNGWSLITCSSGRCRKGLTKTKSGFECEGCKSSVVYPHFRFKLQLDVRDDTASVVVTLFDEPAEKLLSRTAKSLIEEEEQADWDDDVLPPVIHRLVGTKHVFEIKGHSYYQAGGFEGFNCFQVFSAEPSVPVGAISGSKVANIGSVAGSSSMPTKEPQPIPTPSKQREPTKRKLILKEQTTDDLVIGNSGGGLQADQSNREKSVAGNAALEVANADSEADFVALDDAVEGEHMGLPRSSKKRRVSIESGSDSEDLVQPTASIS